MGNGNIDFLVYVGFCLYVGSDGDWWGLLGMYVFIVFFVGGGVLGWREWYVLIWVIGFVFIKVN